MNYDEYSYSNRNMKFVNDLMCRIVASVELDSKHGLSIGGADLAHESVLRKYTHLEVLNDIALYNAEKDSIPYPDDSFDFVFIKSVIEHIHNTDLFLQEIHRVLKDGGRIIILTPDFQKQGDFFYDDYTHVKPFTLGSLKMATQLNGFKIKTAEWFWYYKQIWEGRCPPNFFNVRFAYWLTEKTNIKYFRWGADRQLFVVGEK